MVSPMRSRDYEFNGSAKEFEWLEVLKLCVDKPFLKRPGNEDSSNDGQIIKGPLADIDTVSYTHLTLPTIYSV